MHKVQVYTPQIPIFSALYLGQHYSFFAGVYTLAILSTEVFISVTILYNTGCSVVKEELVSLAFSSGL